MTIKQPAAIIATYVVIESPKGTILADRETGYVNMVQSENKELTNVVRIDFKLYRTHFNDDLPATIKLTKLGYWTNNGKYHKAGNDTMMRRQQPKVKHLRYLRRKFFIPGSRVNVATN